MQVRIVPIADVPAAWRQRWIDKIRNELLHKRQRLEREIEKLDRQLQRLEHHDPSS